MLNVEAVQDQEQRLTGERAWADRFAQAIALGLLLLIPLRWRSYQWDFYMFYGSAQDFLSGVNPYRGEGLSFYHPPILLYVYALFARLPMWLAYQLFYLLKVAALGGLFSLWHRHFLRLKPDWMTVAFFVLAFNASIYADLVAGNVSLFEQLGLWLAFVALLQRRYGLCSLCLILLAQFKLTPIFFAVILLVAPARPQRKWFALCLAGFLAVFSLNQLLQPALLEQFFTVAPVLDERGTLAPGTLAFLRDALDLGGGGGFAAGSRLDELLFLLAGLAVGLVSLHAIVRYRRATPTSDIKIILYFVCVVFALITPRMRCYAQILLLVPTLHLLRTLPRQAVLPLVATVLAALVLFPQAETLLPTRQLSTLLVRYLPLLAAFAVWLGYLRLMGPLWSPRRSALRARPAW